MIKLGAITDTTTVFNKIAVYYNLSIPIGKGIINYEPDPITDKNDVEDFLPDNWTTLTNFNVEYYKGRYLDLEFTLSNGNVFLTSAPWITILGFNSELSEPEIEDLLTNHVSDGISNPNILLRHQHRMVSFKEIVNSQQSNIMSDGGITEDQKKTNYDLKIITNNKIKELIENYSERF